jgi:uncharacterized protein YpuA (DUF1002 family)
MVIFINQTTTAMSFLKTKHVDISQDPNIINYPLLGDIIIEIQGDLEIDKPAETDIAKTFKFGQLDFNLRLNDEQIDQICQELLITKDEIDINKLSQISQTLKDDICNCNNKKEVVVYIGTKQRLIGKLLKLPSPLALMQFDHENNVKIEKIIKYKFQFVDRPLPIM